MQGVVTHRAEQAIRTRQGRIGQGNNLGRREGPAGQGRQEEQVRFAGECRAAGKAVTVVHGRAGRQGSARQVCKAFQVGHGKKAWHAGQGRQARAGQAVKAGRAVQAGQGTQGRQAGRPGKQSMQAGQGLHAGQAEQAKQACHQGNGRAGILGIAVWPGRQRRLGRAG